jgi:hypothetical protein
VKKGQALLFGVKILSLKHIDFFSHNVSGPTRQPEAPPSFGQSFISSTPIKAEAPFKPIVESKVAMPPPPVLAQPSQPISLAPSPQAFPKPAPILPKGTIHILRKLL